MNDNFISIIRECGVVGAGGAGFPTHVKLASKAEILVVNGAECEPLLRVDQILMAEKFQEFLSSVEFVRKNLKASKAVIGLKSKYKLALQALKIPIVSYPNIELFEMGNFYPAGDEQILVYEATGRIVPEGGIPLNVGVVVLNVETVINIYEAIVNNKPVTQKYLTVTGDVRSRLTMKVPIGISIREAIERAGGTDLKEFSVINGGPMMGKIVESLDESITKTTKGLIVLSKNHRLIQTFYKDISRMLIEARTACMHCNLCTEVCPRNMIGHSIEPSKLIRIASYGKICEGNIKSTTAFLCCECRLCQYACVMDLQPWKLNKTLKDHLSKNGIRNPHSNEPKEVHTFREYKKYPVNKLIRQLALTKYDLDAPLERGEEIKYSRVKIELKQHVGAPAVPLVEIGDEVKEGQMIGTIDEGKLGAAVHSSISGVVEKVDYNSIIITSKEV